MTWHETCDNLLGDKKGCEYMGRNDSVNDKKYYHHSGYPGGIKEETYKDIMAKKSDFALERAIKGMLPKNSLGRKMFKKLKCYKGSEHPHEAQQPVALSIKGGRR